MLNSSKCIICKKECSKNKDICETCESFFEWKHKTNFKKRLRELKKYFSKESNSIKFREDKMKSKTLAIFGLVFFLSMVAMQFVMAVDFNQPISSEDKQTFDQILEPVMKIYNLIKYVATVVAVIVLLFAGLTYMTAGSNPAKREQAKSMIMYVVIGLVVIWIAPLIVNFIVS